uniref:hypothetical protein n=1 Tax=Francisella tularensis TaxID=263 RepID=UPI001C0EE5A1
IRQTFWTFLNLEVNLIQWTTLVQLEITGPTAEFIERIAALFEDAAPSSPWLTAAESEVLKPRIFIGHGGSSTA